MRVILSILATALVTLTAYGQSSAIPFVTPYPGSTLGEPVSVAEYEDYHLLAGPIKDSSSTNIVGGRVTRILLRGPKDRSLLEIFTNYEEALRKEGFAILYRCASKDCGTGKPEEMNTAFNQTVEQYYLAARKNRPEGPVYVAVMVNDRHNPATRVHVIEPKPMETGLVKVTADQMSRDLEATGRVVLYSILFDTGKAEVKPESDSTIAEIAKFLTANPNLKIYVVGHTDNTGTYDGNVDLSNRRAEAVVSVLASRHGIAKQRLGAVGVASVAPVATNRTAEGRRLNRRVELVEQ